MDMLPKLDESFKKAFIEWENQVADAWAAMLRDPDFLKGVWGSVETTLAQQRTVNHMIQQNLAALNLPTREKQTRIQEQIERLQRIVAELNAQVDGLLEEVTER